MTIYRDYIGITKIYKDYIGIIQGLEGFTRIL